MSLISGESASGHFGSVITTGLECKFCPSFLMILYGLSVEEKKTQQWQPLSYLIHHCKHLETDSSLDL